MNTTTLRLVVGVLWLLFSAIPIAVADQPSPLPNTFVHDFAGVISDDWKAQIQSKSQRLKDEYKTEIALVTISSLEGEDVFDYSMKLARDWGIGSKDNDIRGLLVLVAINERKTAFRTSRHIEGEIPDAVTAEISKEMNAFFKRGDFGGGLSAGMDKILERMQVVYESPQNNSSSTGLGWLWALIIGLPVALVGFFVLRVRQKLREQLAEHETARRRAELDRIAAARAASKPRGKQKKGKTARSGKRKSGAKDSKPSSDYRPSYESSSSSYDSGSSSSYDSGSSSSSDSGSSYSGGSDFGGGGSDSSW